ncbi:hypothetical protein M514_01687 [Trichuris suis]|uniref:Uncharacterized protein n=1 Tax=Trichuris suis TaxID=68888 RepID=A0A085N5X6_9BILA|nr:hypothetical protein M513_01687 [Trichuris suis]KFD64872.1 hypothetical protein M514_01687 [Trichuris suis]
MRESFSSCKKGYCNDNSVHNPVARRTSQCQQRFKGNLFMLAQLKTDDSSDPAITKRDHWKLIAPLAGLYDKQRKGYLALMQTEWEKCS